ncbi:MAG TPA: class I SAM-dependent methyltransferase [Solirubrobacterales bacterium]|nr:class I SAM-dependent methyltransferase [Solirubrobacterales bacterium]
MSLDERVRTHFDADAERFDAIYEKRKGPIRWFVDEVWRGVVGTRFELTLERLAPLEGKRVLDVGCGSGRYCVAFALRGASRAVGLDVAPAMLELARRHADRAETANVCDFRLARFPHSDEVPGEVFDCCTAMGYFDYVEAPREHLERMRELTSGTLAASFPKSRGVRALLRRLRFRLNRCPLVLYSRDEVESLLVEAGIDDYELVELDRDYLLFARA